MAEIEGFLIDSRTVELDPYTLTPAARDFEGRRYRYYCPLSRIALHTSGEVRILPRSLDYLIPLFGRLSSLPEDQEKFNLFKAQQLAQGRQLELGVEVAVRDNRLYYPNDDIGMWERVPEAMKTTMTDRLQVWNELSRASLLKRL